MTNTGKFHLVNGEPKPCKAKIRECPVGGDHYPNEATARKAYENNNSSKTFNNIRKQPRTLKGDIKNITIAANTPKGRRIAGVAVTGSLVAGGFMVGAHQGPNMENDFQKTPYGVSVNVADSGGQPYSGYVVGANLKHSDFKECAPNYNSDGTASTISCKTVDGKFVVTAQPDAVKDSGRSYQTLNNMSVKDAATNKTINLEHSKMSGGDNLFMAKNTVGK